MRLPNPSRETKFSRANGDREESIFPVQLADHEQDWQPYPVDPYPCYMCDDDTYMHTHILVGTFNMPTSNQ